MDNFINLSEEKQIFKQGHTLSLIKFNDKIYAYKGGIMFDEIELWRGKDIFSLKSQGIILKNKRWAVVIVVNNIIHLYCTYHKNYKKDLFKYQNIYYYTSSDGIDFKGHGIVTSGSAPWICKFNNTYYLYYHKKTDASHDILVRCGRNISDLGFSEEKLVINIPVSDGTLSAPSVVYFDNQYRMTCEYCNPNQMWQTRLYSSRDSIRGFKSYSTLLDNGCACAFQYIFDNKYIITYSTFKDNIWDICAKEGVL